MSTVFRLQRHLYDRLHYRSRQPDIDVSMHFLSTLYLTSQPGVMTSTAICVPVYEARAWRDVTRRVRSPGTRRPPVNVDGRQLSAGHERVMSSNISVVCLVVTTRFAEPYSSNSQDTFLSFLVCGLNRRSHRLDNMEITLGDISFHANGKPHLLVLCEIELCHQTVAAGLSRYVSGITQHGI